MKAIFSVILASMILFLSAGFRVATHYCGDVAVTTSLTTDGVKPQKKKVEAMQRIKRPTTPKQLRTFLGLVNFYRDVWEKRSHILAPLSKLSSVKPKDWTWGREQEIAFRKIKNVLSKEAISLSRFQ